MSPLARVAAGLVRAYQLVVSPWVTVSCKYYPSCSAYALEAVRTHGAIRGIRMAGWRFLRCNPWSRGGVDHVPPRTRSGHTSTASAAQHPALPVSNGPLRRSGSLRSSRAELNGPLRRSAALRSSRAERT